MSAALRAQTTTFITNGTIIYKKEINVFALIQKKYDGNNDFLINRQIDDYKSKYPDRIRKISYVMSFSKNNSMYYRSSPLDIEESSTIGRVFGSENRTYNDFRVDSIISQKNILGELYEVHDKTPDVIWKITDEIRNIAGFTCRRANGLMYDSLYIVAFFSTQIPVRGGPETFHGLPGMILGVAVPSLHTSIFATSVILRNDNTDVQLSMPKKATTISTKALIDKMKATLKDWQILQAIL